MAGLQKISEVLGKVQESTVNNQKYILILKKIYENHEFDDFVKEFLRCLKHFLIEDILQNHYANNGLEFCAIFITSLKIDCSQQLVCPFMKTIILKVLELHNVSQARYRVCLFINQVLQQLNKKDEGIDATLSENIKEVMFERMQDVKSVVQIQAIEILARLQDSGDLNDPVIKALMKCLCDRNIQVRKTILRCIGLNGNSTPVVLKRCLDTDESVRYSAYKAISKLPITALKIEQRQYVLENGLKNDNEKIRTFVQKTLLSHWLSYFNGDYFQLICALKLDADERDWKRSVEIVEKTLDIYFSFDELKNLLEILPLGSDKLITSSEIKWEQLIYWRCLSSFLRKNENTIDYLEEILPELTIFCEFILRVCKNGYKYTEAFDILAHDQLMLELWKIVKDFDFSDEIGRRNLHKLIKDILIDANLSYNNVLLMVKILEQLYPSIEERTEQLTDIISEIRNPLIKQQLPDCIIRQQKVEIAKYRVELNIAVDAEEQVILKKDFNSAKELKEKIEELKRKIECLNEEYHEFEEVRIPRNDVQTLSKCLDILIAFLSSPTIKTLPVAIITLQKEFVQPLLISPLPEIYLKAMKLYGLVCIADKMMAQISVMFFCEPILSYKYVANDVQRILLAIACITDLLVLHGRNILEPIRDNQNTTSPNSSTSRTDSSETASITNIVEVFARMLDDANAEIRERSCEAIVKLMCRGVISSSVLLSKLILKWFNPATAKDVRLRQLLGCLFVEYVTEVPGSLKIVEDAFIPTLLSVVKAPRYSPLANVSVESTLKFLIELSRPGRNKFNKNLDSHANIALLLCREIYNTPNDNCTTVYLKALIMLDTPTKNEIALGKLREFIDTMCELIKDKTVLNYVQKYKNRLESNMEQSISTIDTRTTNTSRNSSKLSQSMESNLNEYSVKKPKQSDKSEKCSSSKNSNRNETIRGSEQENNMRQTVTSLDSTPIRNNSASSQIASLETDHVELENKRMNYVPQTEKNK